MYLTIVRSIGMILALFNRKKQNRKEVRIRITIKSTDIKGGFYKFQNKSSLSYSEFIIKPGIRGEQIVSMPFYNAVLTWGHS